MSVRNISKKLRSPRSTAKLVEHLPCECCDLLVVTRPVKLTKIDTAEGVQNVDFSEWLWKNNQVQAQLALQTGFIQGIKSGLLDPTDYGGYTVQDAVYCYNATEYYKIALKKAEGDANMTAFIEGRIKSYTKYTEDMFKQWYIANPSGIAMGKAACEYTCFERGVAEKMEPFYLLIAMLPCEKLWEWLSQQIESGISPTNVYSFWIEGNLGGSHKLATFINENAEKYKVKPGQANDVYKGGMDGEVGFFRSATAESN